jgi:hypothetical protein
MLGKGVDGTLKEINAGEVGFKGWDIGYKVRRQR